MAITIAIRQVKLDRRIQGSVGLEIWTHALSLTTPMPPAPPTKPEYIPPSLAYLVIYNPTLHPETSDADDDDDIEQAHIVFYTARERAVSRDLMLRQVGLAKALTNFAE